MNKFNILKQRRGRLAFVFSCLLHVAAGALIIFLARKVFVQRPSMGSGDVMRISDIYAEELHAASSAESPPQVQPPPEPVSDMPEVFEKKAEPVAPVNETPAPEKKETASTASAGSAQTVQSASSSGTATSAEPMAGRGSAEADWQARAKAKVRAMVEHEKYYPEPARRAGYTGWCVVHVRLTADGTVAGYEVGERKGNPLLSKGAEAALAKIQGRSIGTKLPEPLDVAFRIEFELK